MPDKLVIATRESALALWQANYVADELRKAHPGLVVELLPMTTKGDQLLDSPLARIGGKGLFVKELERALLEERADLAVHSMKDVPAEFPDGLGLTAIMAREDPHDALISNKYATLDDLPEAAVVGTASQRRQSQLLNWRPDLQIRMLRGNVNTRLAKLDAGEYDAIILAAAGMKRLEMPERIRQIIPPERLLPAVGQGALGIECRMDDRKTRNYLKILADESTTQRVVAERTLSAALGGSCQVPIGGYAELDSEGTLRLRALVAQPDGSKILRCEKQGDSSDPIALGNLAAEELKAQGADEILASLATEAS